MASRGKLMVDLSLIKTDTGNNENNGEPSKKSFVTDLSMTVKEKTGYLENTLLSYAKSNKTELNCHKIIETRTETRTKPSNQEYIIDTELHTNLFNKALLSEQEISEKTLTFRHKENQDLLNFLPEQLPNIFTDNARADYVDNFATGISKNNENNGELINKKCVETYSNKTNREKTDFKTAYNEKTLFSDKRNNKTEWNEHKDSETRTEPSNQEYIIIDTELNTNHYDKTLLSGQEISEKIPTFNENEDSVDYVKQQSTMCTENYSMDDSNSSKNDENIPCLVQNHSQHSAPLNEDDLTRPSTSKDGWCVQVSEVDTRIRLKRVCNNSYKILQESLSDSEIDNTDSDPDFDIRDEYKVKRNKSCLFNYNKNGLNINKHNRIGNLSFFQDSLSPNISIGTLSTSTADNIEQLQNIAPESIDPVQNIPSKGKKRKSNPHVWKSVNAKMLRNSGQQYTSKSNKIVPAKAVRPPCGDKCRLKCKTKISEEQRKEIFDKYWQLSDITRQRDYISKCMEPVKPKYRYPNPESKRRLNHAFFFVVNEVQVKICKDFFCATLDVPNRYLRTTVDKTQNGFVQQDLRGKHGKHKTVDADIKDGVRQHINSIPRIESHYLRKQSTRQYIEGGKTLSDLYRDYKESCIENNKPFANLVMYSRIFNYEFNISFFTPKKDQCDFCTSYNLSTPEEKDNLKDKYNMHIREKELSRISKEEDKSKVDENFIVACYDLQAVLPVPKGEASQFYYKSKLNCLNFTICELKTKKVFCYAWHEGEGSRGVNELGTCVLKYLEDKSKDVNDPNLEIVLYSDNCGGQQKNKYMIGMYMFAVTRLPIKAITHKFLIKGHTQNEGDNAHSVIEKETKKVLKSGPIYVPSQYFTTIRTAKKSGTPFQVTEMCHEDFLDIKRMYDHCGFVATTAKKDKEDEEEDHLKLSKAHIIRIEKANPNRILYKDLYAETEFKEEIVKIKRKRKTSLEKVTIEKAYNEKLQIAARKKADLTSLVACNLVPNYYKEFYNNL